MNRISFEPINWNTVFFLNGIQEVWVDSTGYAILAADYGVLSYFTSDRRISKKFKKFVAKRYSALKNTPETP